MIMLDDSTAVVSDHASLADAVSGNNGIDYIYLDASINMTAGIIVYPGKPSLVIDGHYPEESTVFHTLTDTGSDSGMIYINAASSIDFTFQNLIINGRNFYGMPFVYDIQANQNVTVTYRNVTYTGPQMTWHLRGLVRYIDCDITIMFANYSVMNEVAELNRVEIGGRTVIRHNNTGYATFNFYYENPSVTILEDARVEITTLYDLLHMNGYNVSFTVEPRAHITVTTTRAFTRGSGHRLASLLVDKAATFRYIRNTSAGGGVSVYVQGGITVNEGATVYLQADFMNTGPMIRFMSSASFLTANNPKSFVIYNRGSVTAADVLAFAYETPFIIKTGQINYWINAKLFSTAGTFDDIPDCKWNRPDWSGFEISGSANTDATDVTDNTFSEEELEDLEPLTRLQFQGAQVLSFGDLLLKPNTVLEGRPVTGKSDPMAYVKVEYAAGDIVYSQAGEDGRFTCASPAVLPFGTLVTISANTPFLIVAMAMVSQEEGELTILSAPETIVFATRPMDGFTDIILPRRVTEASVVVSDLRVDRTAWQLWARITDHLKTVENDVLNNAVVFIIQDGSMETLKIDEFTPIHNGEPFDEDDLEVDWVATRGVLLRITDPIRSGKTYTTQLMWEIHPVVIEPVREGLQ